MIDQRAIAMAFPQDLSFPMDIDIDQSPSIMGNQNTPSSGNFSDELDEAILNFNTLTGGPSSLPSLTQLSTDSLSESAFRGNTIQNGNDDNSYNSIRGYIVGINDRISENPESPTSHHFQLHCHQPRKDSAVDISEGIKPCSPNTRTCMVLAQKVFAALHTPSIVCLSVYSDSPTEAASSRRKVDLILSINRQAIQAVSKILKCICSSSSSMQLVLVSICNKVAVWYRALARTSLQQSQASDDIGLFASPPLTNKASIANNGFSPNNNHNYDHDMVSDDYSHQVIHQPLSLGAYVVDIALDSRLRVLVVQSELQHMERMINSLSSHIKETKFGTCVVAQTAQSTVTRNSPPTTTRASNFTNGSSEYEEQKQENFFFGENVTQSLASFLNWQLQNVKTDIAAALNLSQ